MNLIFVFRLDWNLAELQVGGCLEAKDCKE